MMGFGFLGMALFWCILIALTVGGAVWAFRQTAEARSADGQRQPTACQILDERFARGEISADEYAAIRARLGN